MKIMDLPITELERRGLLVTISSPYFDDGWGLALWAPQDYVPKDDDPPVFYFNELAGIARHGHPEMIKGLYEVKKHFKNAKGTAICKTTGR